MTGQFITIQGVNPEPWAAGIANAGRRGGTVKASMSPNAKLQVYQNALREEVEFMVQEYALVAFTGRMRLKVLVLASGRDRTWWRHSQGDDRQLR